MMTTPIPCSATSKVNLLDYNQLGLCQLLQGFGESSYRGQQVFQWLHQYGICDFEKMSNISKALRDKLTNLTECRLPEVAMDSVAADGTRKWLLRLPEGNCIETVYIPEKTRGTLCVSSQVGCALNCSFCSTAKQGFSRNLTVSEIIGQVWIAVRLLSEKNGLHDHHITNVVLMGMGEPLLNYQNVLTAMQIMLDDLAYGLAKRRVTLSTSGVAPALMQLQKDSEVAVALSLHAPNDELRNQLVPLNKRYPIAQLMAICKNYFPKGSKRSITMEYVMLKNVNDQPHHAKQLAKLLRDIPCKVNLIPFNPYSLALYERSPVNVIEQFKAILQQAGINTMVRRTRGDDIDAACGQLAGKFKDITSRSRLLKNKAIAILQKSTTNSEIVI